MEVTVQSLYHANLPLTSSISRLPTSLFQSKPLLLHSPHSWKPHQAVGVRISAVQFRNISALNASSNGDSPSSTDVAETETWLLQPVGDGDSRHIGYKVEMPGAFEIASNDVTVGRLPQKADMVIPVATVSAVHARIQKEGGNLLVTDLDSTNGTFVDEKRLRPGLAVPVSSGSCVTFGDTHFAMFLVSKLEKVEPQQSEDKPESDSLAGSTDQTTS